MKIDGTGEKTIVTFEVNTADLKAAMAKKYGRAYFHKDVIASILSDPRYLYLLDFVYVQSDDPNPADDPIDWLSPPDQWRVVNGQGAKVLPPPNWNRAMDISHSLVENAILLQTLNAIALGRGIAIGELVEELLIEAVTD